MYIDGIEVIKYRILKRLFKSIILKYPVKYRSVIFAYSLLFHALW